MAIARWFGIANVTLKTVSILILLLTVEGIISIVAFMDMECNKSRFSANYYCFL